MLAPRAAAIAVRRLGLLFLYPLVTDGTGGRQAFLDMASLQDLPRPVGIVRPDYGEAVGQKLHANLDGVGFLAAGALLKVSHLTRDPERRLHVVTDLVGDDIGLGEIAGCVKTVRQILKKCQIDWYSTFPDHFSVMTTVIPDSPDRIRLR